MHRSNIIYNYDIPWNATRLMQRIGRINRIGTRHDHIYVYNFIPLAKSDALIELSKKAFVKLQTFHSTFGEDNQIYSTEEEVGSVELFEDLGEEVDEELEYLEEIRKFKEAKPDQFKALCKLPPKVRVQRKGNAITKDSSFVFLKNSRSKSYYLVSHDECEAINFLQMAKYLKCSAREKAVMPIAKLHYEQVQRAYDAYQKELEQIVVVVETSKISNVTDKKAVRLLKGWRDKGYIDNIVYKRFKTLFDAGRYQNLGKQIKQLEKLTVAEIKNRLAKMQEEYSILGSQEASVKRVSLDAQVILSETFVGV